MDKARNLDRRRDQKAISTPALYEVAFGTMLSRSRTEVAALRSLATKYLILPFDEPAAMKAAEIRAELTRLGKVKSHVDTMIAGVAAAGGHVLLTRDRDFSAMADAVELSVETY